MSRNPPKVFENRREEGHSKLRSGAAVNGAAVNESESRATSAHRCARKPNSSRFPLTRIMHD